MILLLFFINLALSSFNAWSVGRGWVEAKREGGWPRFIAWCGATMAACGFTWCLLLVISFMAMGLRLLSEEQVRVVFELGYVALVVPLLGTGLAITVQSWAAFWRRRTLANGAIAGWNTAADLYNLYTAAEALPGILSHLGDFFSAMGSSSSSSGSDDETEGAGAGLVVLVIVALVAVAFAGGVLLTAIIIRASSRGHATTQARSVMEREVRHGQ